jgi:hypothetical protein
MFRMSIRSNEHKFSLKQSKYWRSTLMDLNDPDVYAGPPIKDTGKRHTFSTGAQRQPKTGLGRPDLISVIATMRKAVHLEKGAVGHGERNWEQGMPLSSFLASAWRHLLALTDGCEDEDHAAALAFNVDGYMHTEHLIRCGRLPAELDDVPRQKNLLAIRLTPDAEPPTVDKPADDRPQDPKSGGPDFLKSGRQCGKCGKVMSDSAWRKYRELSPHSEHPIQCERCGRIRNVNR